VVGRDKDLRHFATEVDVLIFVGGTRSSNTKSLYEVCRHANPRSYLITSENDIDRTWFRSEDTVGVSGSASTPQWQLAYVKRFLKKLRSIEEPVRDTAGNIR